MVPKSYLSHVESKRGETGHAIQMIQNSVPLNREGINQRGCLRQGVGQIRDALQQNHSLKGSNIDLKTLCKKNNNLVKLRQ